MKRLSRSTVCFVLLLSALCASGHAQTEGGIVAWQVTRFDLNATLPAAGTSERALAVRANLTARNIGNGTGRTLTVRLSPAAEIKTVTVGDATATFFKREDTRTKTQTAQINLPAPVAPNATVSVTLDYTLTIAGQNTGVAAISPEGVQFLPVSFWYPTPNTLYAVRGADYAPVHLTVNAPGGTTVVSSGQTSGASFEQKLNAQPFFLTGKWETVEGAGDARGVSALLFSGASADERRQAEQLIALAAAARTFFAGLLGPAPDAPIRLVAVRRGAGFDMAGTTLLDAAAFRRSKVDASSALAIAESVARLWLGSATPVRGEGSGALREGLIRYLATLMLEKQFGREAADAERLRQRIAYSAIVRRDAPLAQTTPLDPTYYTSAANKGAMVWRLAERMLGRDAFIAVLRAQMQTGELSLAAWRAALNSSGGAPLKTLLDAQLDQPTDLDLQIGLPQQRGAEWVSALRNTGAQPVAVKIVATTETGQQFASDVIIPAQDFAEAHFKTAAKLVRAEIDPDKLYPQVDYGNDAAPRAPGLEDAFAEATRLYGSGDYAHAETTARTMLQAAPLMQEARILLARALLEQNKLPDAEREFRAALDDKLPLPATLAWGAYGLGEIAQRKGQTAEAVKRYDEAARAEGGYAPTLAARTARLKAETAPAPEESVKQFFTQLDTAIRGGRKADLDALVVPGELLNFTKGFVIIQPEQWQSRVLRTESIGGDRIAADVTIAAKSEGRDKTVTALFILARIGGQLRLAEIPIFEER
ncbi:MAG TPA: tetratricopeptide repeat protein [Pyrinomonadaceae bacterium]|jgi:TolA-binding protein